MDNKRLKSIVERIERLEEEQAAIGGDKKDVFAEAKSAGFNPKVLRRLIRERKRDKSEREQEEAELETYRAALGTGVALVKSGLSLRDAAKQSGASKSSIHRALSVPAVSHDADTGEITETTKADEAMSVPEEANHPRQDAPLAITTALQAAESDPLDIPEFLQRRRVAQ